MGTVLGVLVQMGTAVRAVALVGLGTAVRAVAGACVAIDALVDVGTAGSLTWRAKSHSPRGDGEQSSSLLKASDTGPTAVSSSQAVQQHRDQRHGHHWNQHKIHPKGYNPYAHPTREAPAKFNYRKTSMGHPAPLGCCTLHAEPGERGSSSLLEPTSSRMRSHCCCCLVSRAGLL